MLAEAVVAAARAWQQGALEALRLVAWTLGLWVLPCGVVAAALAWLLAGLLGDDTLGLALREQWQRAERRRLLQIALLVAAPFVACVFSLARATARFHNVELAAALLSALVVGALLLSVSVGYVIWRTLERRAVGGPRWLGPLALLLAAAV